MLGRKMKRFIEIISPERANAYKLSRDEDDLAILTRYVNNIKISEAFYPLLDFFEVSLRNRINNVLVEDYGDDWLLDNDFFDDETQNAVQEAVDRLAKKRKNPANYRLVAELNFGFWSNLFNNKYHVIWQQEKRMKRIFVNGKHDIKEVNKELEILRKFRNRVFHFETIYNHHPERCYGLLYKYINSMSPNDDFLTIIKGLDRLRELLEIDN